MDQESKPQNFAHPYRRQKIFTEFFSLEHSVENIGNKVVTKYNTTTP